MWVYNLSKMNIETNCIKGGNCVEEYPTVCIGVASLYTVFFSASVCMYVRLVYSSVYLSEHPLRMQRYTICSVQKNNDAMFVNFLNVDFFF